MEVVLTVLVLAGVAAGAYILLAMVEAMQESDDQEEG